MSEKYASMIDSSEHDKCVRVPEDIDYQAPIKVKDFLKILTESTFAQFEDNLSMADFLNKVVITDFDNNQPDYIRAAYAYGLIDEVPANLNNYMTRKDLAIYMANFSQSQASCFGLKFITTKYSDVKNYSEYMQRAIEEAYNNGFRFIFPEKTFKPEKQITAEEAITSVYWCNSNVRNIIALRGVIYDFDEELPNGVVISKNEVKYPYYDSSYKITKRQKRELIQVGDKDFDYDVNTAALICPGRGNFMSKYKDFIHNRNYQEVDLGWGKVEVWGEDYLVKYTLYPDRMFVTAEKSYGFDITPSPIPMY